MRKTVGDWLKLFRLAKREGVSEACRRMEVSRDSYYRRLKDYKRGGRAALKPTSRRRPLKNPRVKPEVEAAVVDIARQHPEWGKRTVSSRLSRDWHRGLSETGVLGVWRRHQIPTTHEARMHWAKMTRPKGWKPLLSPKEERRRTASPITITDKSGQVRTVEARKWIESG
jgi:transposase